MVQNSTVAIDPSNPDTQKGSMVGDEDIFKDEMSEKDQPQKTTFGDAYFLKQSQIDEFHRNEM